MTDTEVIIAGLGPTGLTLAHLLGRRGIGVLVLEREPEFYGNARAVYTDDEALRVFQTAGVADEIHADMNVDSAVQWVKADGSVLVQFRETKRPNWWPISNFFYQPYLETTLEASLARYPHVEVRRGRELIDFTQDATGVTVTHVAATGSTPEAVRGAYLIGADGGRSVVRQQLGIEMTGKSYPERWLVVDLAGKDGADPFRHLPYFDFVCDPTMPVVSCPLPGGHHRFEFELSDADDKADFESDATVARLIGRYVDVDEVEVRRKLVYTFNAVTANTWRTGRVLLAGDAAHMTPQFVGQGMNAGVRDADNLSWKLESVLRHGAADTLLDSYQTERKPHAQSMIDFSVFNKSLVSIKNPIGGRARDLAMRTSTRLPGVGEWVRQAGMKPKPRLARGGYVGMPRGRLGVAGTLAPQPMVRSYRGRPARFDDAVGIGWVVLGIGVDPRESLGADAATWDRVEATYVTLIASGQRPRGRAAVAPEGLLDLEDIEDGWASWLRRHRIRSGELVVLRPDKFVFGTGRDTAALTQQLRRQLGLN